MFGLPVPGRPTARREPPTMSISAPRLAPNTLALTGKRELASIPNSFLVSSLPMNIWAPESATTLTVIGLICLPGMAEGGGRLVAK